MKRTGRGGGTTRSETDAVVELRIHAGMTKFVAIVDLIKRTIKVGGTCVCVWLIMHGLGDLAHNQSRSISAIAEVVKALAITDWLPYIALTGTTVGWIYERTGKKRIVKKLGEFRHQIEARDQYSDGSGLNHRGENSEE